MFIIKRKRGERVTIRVGETEILVTIQAFDRGSVVLGFEAPRHVEISRSEIIEVGAAPICTFTSNEKEVTP